MSALIRVDPRSAAEAVDTETWAARATCAKVTAAMERIEPQTGTISPVVLLRLTWQGFRQGYGGTFVVTLGTAPAPGPHR